MLRQRRKKNAERRPRKSSFSTPRHRKKYGPGQTAWILDVLGIRPLREDPVLSPEQKRAKEIDSVISFVLFVITIFTRFYRLAVPAKIGKESISAPVLIVSNNSFPV